MLDPRSMLDEEDESADATMEAVGDVPRGTFWSFVATVILTQVGLAAVSIGLMFGWFLDQWGIGGQLIAVGVLTLGVTAGIYWRHRATRESD